MLYGVCRWKLALICLSIVAVGRGAEEKVAAESLSHFPSRSFRYRALAGIAGSSQALTKMLSKYHDSALMDFITSEVLIVFPTPEMQREIIRRALVGTPWTMKRPLELHESGGRACEEGGDPTIEVYFDFNRVKKIDWYFGNITNAKRSRPAVLSLLYASQQEITDGEPIDRLKYQ